MASHHHRRAVVIGGSIAGLFVAAFLRRIEWQVDIYERSSVDLIGRGVGIVAHHLELFEALDKCGAGTVDLGVIVYKRITLDRIEQPFFTSVYDFCSPSLVFGRVVLVGDAASTPRPHIGFGLSKAGAEALALAEALANYDDLDRALAAYNAARQPLSERIVLHSRKLGYATRRRDRDRGRSPVGEIATKPQRHSGLDWGTEFLGT